jgi:hypothetical protein
MMRAAVVLSALLVVLLATPLPMAATPEGEPTWTAHLGWSPTGELACPPGLDARAPRAAASIAPPAATVGHDRLRTRK